jgi:predicted lipoprotein with Yx(FWY)xxD motif
MNQKILIVIIAILVIAGIYWVSEQGVKESAVNTPTNNTVISGPVGVTTGAGGEKHLTDTNGMTLYVNIKDEGQTAGNIQSVCDLECEKTWLPYIFDEDQPVITESNDPLLSKVNVFTRSDGRQQYALGTKPLYVNINDLNPSDMNGDMSENWMVAQP